MTILAIDFMNAAHRARSGFKMGPAPVVYNFFKQIKSLVDQFKPSRIYVALEGRPVKRYESLETYKANRKVDQDDPRAEELQRFFKQKDVIQNLLENYFPVSVIRHPTSECDDTIANIVRTSSTAVPWIIVSTDTDFIQLLQSHSHVKLYNPVKKQFVESPEDYDYVVWKSLRGDSSDNIPGIPGIGDKTAEKIASDPELLSEQITRPEVEPIFSRNYNLIKFDEWTEEEQLHMTSSDPAKDWEKVRAVFDQYGFKSITSEESWKKFVDTFDALWGE